MSSKQTVLVVDFPTVASKVISVAAAMASTLNMPSAMLVCTQSTDG